METIKIKKRVLDSITTKNGTINKAILQSLSRTIIADGKIYTGYYTGSGRYTNRCSVMDTVKKILELQGYKYEASNDAPRGGADGEHLKVSSTAVKFIEKIKKL